MSHVHLRDTDTAPTLPSDENSELYRRILFSQTMFDTERHQANMHAFERDESLLDGETRNQPRSADTTSKYGSRLRPVEKQDGISRSKHRIQFKEDAPRPYETYTAGVHGTKHSGHKVGDGSTVKPVQTEEEVLEARKAKFYKRQKDTAAESYLNSFHLAPHLPIDWNSTMESEFPTISKLKDNSSRGIRAAVEHGTVPASERDTWDSSHCLSKQELAKKFPDLTTLGPEDSRDHIAYAHGLRKLIDGNYRIVLSEADRDTLLPLTEGYSGPVKKTVRELITEADASVMTNLKTAGPYQCAEVWDQFTLETAASKLGEGCVTMSEEGPRLDECFPLRLPDYSVATSKNSRLKKEMHLRGMDVRTYKDLFGYLTLAEAEEDAETLEHDRKYDMRAANMVKYSGQNIVIIPDNPTHARELMESMRGPVERQESRTPGCTSEGCTTKWHTSCMTKSLGLSDKGFRKLVENGQWQDMADGVTGPGRKGRPKLRWSAENVTATHLPEDDLKVEVSRAVTDDTHKGISQADMEDLDSWFGGSEDNADEKTDLAVQQGLSKTKAETTYTAQDLRDTLEEYIVNERLDESTVNPNMSGRYYRDALKEFIDSQPGTTDPNASVIPASMVQPLLERLQSDRSSRKESRYSQTGTGLPLTTGVGTAVAVY
jgi:hypothetical protein